VSRRHSRAALDRASVQLRAWGKSGALGLNDAAHEAMVGAAEALGFPGISEACSAGAWPDMMSEAIEAVEADG
jgi:hypothetical protein